MLPYKQGTSFRPQSVRVSPLPRSVSVGTQTAFPDYLTTDGYDGIYDCSGTARSTEDAPVPAVDPLSLVVCMVSPQQKANDNHCLYVGSQPLAGTRTVVPRFANRERNLSQGSTHGCLPEGVEGFVQWRGREGGLDTSTIQSPHKLPGALSGSATFLPGSVKPTCSGQDRQHHYDFIHKQTGRDSFTSSLEAITHPLAVVQHTLSVYQSYSCPGTTESGCRFALQRRTSGERVE
ncbi:hypothetical protein XENORESO_022086, partial [Xenotaenia resolanae]